MRALRLAIVAAAFGVAAATTAAAEPSRPTDTASPWVALHASRVRLVSGEAQAPVAAKMQSAGQSSASARGGVRLAGLEIAMDDGWKTYWRNPGDAGVPPQFDWSGSTNVAGIKILYPAPMRMREAGGDAIGYKHHVLFPIEVTPQDAAKPVALKLSLEYGICRDICVPATANLDLALPPGPAPARSETSDAVAAAIDRVPRASASRRPTDPELREVTIGNGQGARLAIAAAFHGDGGDVFVEAPDGLYVPPLRSLGRGADGVTRYAVDLSGDLVHDFKGKTLTLTLVSAAGATEARWTVP